MVPMGARRPNGAQLLFPSPAKRWGGIKGGGGAADAAVSECADRPPTPDPSPPRADARGGRGEKTSWIFRRHIPSLRAQRSNPLFLCAADGLLRCARNDGETHLRISRRKAPEFGLLVPPSLQRAQGMPGAWCARSRACSVGSTRVSHHGHTGNAGIPRAMVLTAYFALSPGDRACLPPSPQRSSLLNEKLASQELDASVGASGPHDFAVRFRAVRQRRIRVHRIPHQRS